MISKIAFDDVLVLEQKEADELNLEYRVILEGRLGVKDDKLVKLESYDVIRDVTVFYNEELSAWTTKDGRVKESYYIYDKPSEYQLSKNWVEVNKEQLVDLNVFLQACKYPFRVIKTVMDSQSPNILPVVLSELNKKLLSTIESIEVLQKTSLNSKCEVHMGGSLLLTINELKLIEDCCTDALQEELNSGWRIVSVNVQPNQRRSDYVLGRYNPNKNN